MDKKIDLIVSANVIALHLLDYASRWDYYIHDEIADWVHAHVPDKTKLQELCTRYAPPRKALGWGEQIALMTWASKDFPSDTFPLFNEILQEWLKVELQGGKSVQDTSEEVCAQISTQLPMLEGKLAELQIAEIIDKLHPYSPLLKVIVSYLVTWCGALCLIVSRVVPMEMVFMSK